VQAAFLYGPRSHFPNTDISLTSTRFRSTLTFSLFRRQLWSGERYYYDEQGWRFSSRRPIFLDKSIINIEHGLLFGVRKHYLGGPFRLPEGRIFEPFLNVEWRRSLRPYFLTVSVLGRAAPTLLNKDFEYNSLGVEAEVARNFNFLTSQLSLGVKTSRVRGKDEKTPVLRELYVPVRTFVAGGGGGYNQNNFPVVGPSVLFAPRYGDTQARFQAVYGFPLISDIDKLLWIFYLNKLSFSSFYQYGGAWYQSQNYRDRMLASYGHRFDLTFENKGVSFNLGMGAGRVLPFRYDVFFTAGFDALF
jgi:hypothetical protein